MLKKIAIFVIVILLALMLYIGHMVKSRVSGLENYNHEHVVYVILKSRGTGFWDAVENGAQSIVIKGITVKVSGPGRESDFAEQANMIDTAISEKASAIVLAPQNATVVVDAVRRARAAGIKLVFIDSDLETGMDIPVVSSDNTAIGQIAAEGILKYGGVQRAIVIRGLWGDESQDLRASAAIKALKESGVEVVACESADSSRQKAETLVAQLLGKYRNVGAIFATNDDMALGASDAEIKSNYGIPIYIVGVDATPDGIKAISDNRIDATVSQDAYDMGKQGVLEAIDLINGKSVKTLTTVPSQLLTKNNIALN